MKKLENKIPLDIKIKSKLFPIIDYKKKYGEDCGTENLAKGEIEKFNFAKGMKDNLKVGATAIKITYDEEGKEYSTFWTHLGRDYFKQISKVYDPRNC